MVDSNREVGCGVVRMHHHGDQQGEDFVVEVDLKESGKRARKRTRKGLRARRSVETPLSCSWAATKSEIPQKVRYRQNRKKT